jgi:hypothetical protein
VPDASSAGRAAGGPGDGGALPSSTAGVDASGAEASTSAPSNPASSNPSSLDASSAAIASDAAAPDSGLPRLTGTVRIMPLGDSITGITCWRARLWEELRQAGHSNFRFVGSLDTSGNCSDPSYDGHNEGHVGYLAVDLVGSGMHASEPDQWFSANPADLVLMHLGTNDAWNSVPTANILAAYTGIIGDLRKYSPNAVIVVAKIIPMNRSPPCTGCEPGVEALNAAIPAWARSNATATSPILVVDQWTGFNDATDTADGVHPNDAGSMKMAGRWFDLLVQLF